MGYSVVKNRDEYWVLKLDDKEIGYLQDPAVTMGRADVIEGGIAKNGYKGELNKSSMRISEDDFSEDREHEYMVFEGGEYIGEIFIEVDNGNNEHEVSKYKDMKDYSFRMDFNKFRE